MLNRVAVVTKLIRNSSKEEGNCPEWVGIRRKSGGIVIMQLCKNCGSQFDDGAKFCPACGKPVESAQTEQSKPGTVDLSAKVQAIANTPDSTDQFDRQDVEQNKVMAILAYIGILVLIPIFAAPKSKFARYHANQGLVLFLAEVIFGFAYAIVSGVLLAISWRLAFLVSLIGVLWLTFVALMIVGIVNAAGGKAKELPVIGRIRILK